jgi:hypothetical protein
MFPLPPRSILPHPCPLAGQTFLCGRGYAGAQLERSLTEAIPSSIAAFHEAARGQPTTSLRVVVVVVLVVVIVVCWFSNLTKRVDMAVQHYADSLAAPSSRGLRC